MVMENSEKRLTIKDLAEDDRPREKMEREPQALAMRN